ncbi:TPA: hypothetical protein RQK67_004139 [Vibrio vulnificus]|nr:hypothetical protein [Vibrio vulnificus]
MEIINKNEFEFLKQSFDGQRVYQAKNDAYGFDIFDDIWQLGTKSFVHLTWMYDIGYDWKTFVELRVLLAKMASKLAFNTVDSRQNALKSLGDNLTPSAFRLVWSSLTDPYKKILSGTLSFAVNKAGLKQFKEIADFASEHCPKISAGNNILDPEKGVYSEIEYDSIKEKLRLATDNKIKVCKGPKGILAFSNAMASQLMVALVRRPCQLVQLKWSDLLPVGQGFSDYRQSTEEPTPDSEYLFCDVDCLHIRLFQGKEGLFRVNAERNSRRLEPDLSALIITYRQQYESVLVLSLKKQGISLGLDELHQIMLRCPLFPEEQLFTIQFGSKSNLFKALGSMSDSFHKTSDALQQAISNFSVGLGLKSDRIESSKLRLSNDRLRHTVLTGAALQGLSAPYLASITNVTEKAVSPYIELSFEARLAIDQAFAEKDVLLKFGKMSVKELQNRYNYVVRNEFDEEIGIHINPENCASCASKLGAPLGCYPCDNFTAIEEANHQQYLDKALIKYEVNKQDGNKVTLKKIRKIILYIQATIKICEERKLAEKGLSNG